MVKNNNLDRYILMCYGDAILSDIDITNFVDKAIEKSIDLIKDKNKIILGLTHKELNKKNLN